jgi:choline kinase/uncharacterized membrane protein YbhN (UPF0104 family)
MPSPSTPRSRREALARGIRGAGGPRQGRAKAPQRVAIVLAAGRSERLASRSRGRSKALLRVGGLPLVELSIRRLHTLGIDRVVVAVGHDGDRVAAAARRAGGTVEIVVADGWEAGNGASLLAAESVVGDQERFVVVCADHVFLPGTLEQLVASDDPAVLIDRSPTPEAWSEGTRVRVADGAAVAFGKDLPEPAIDCGAFVLPRQTFSALREASADGDHSLAGAVGRLALVTPIHTVELPLRGGWRDVDTLDDLRAARRIVRRSLAKETDGPVSRYLNRPISTRITVALARFRLHPTVLSIATLLLGMWGAWSLSAGRGVMGALSVQAASIMDGSDGETARLLTRSSSRGAFIDGVCDRMVDAAIVAGLWLWRLDDPSRGFRFASIVTCALVWGIVALALRRPVAIFDIPRREQPILTALFGGRDVRMLVLAAGAALEQPAVAIGTGVIVYGASAIWRASSVLTRRSEQDRGARPGRFRTIAGTAGRVLALPVLVGVLYWGVLPHVADLDDVWGVIRSLSTRSIVALAALGLWNLISYWPMLVAAMPGLSLAQAAVVGESSTAVSMTVPAGGVVAVGLSYSMYASWGFSAAAVAGSALATFFANMYFKLLLPGCALVLLALFGKPTTGLVVAGLAGAAIAIGVALLVAALIRHERPARRLGAAADAAVSFVRGLAGRDPVTMWAERAARFREDIFELLRDRWQPLFTAELVSQLSLFAVLLAALRLLHVTANEVSGAQIFAVFTFVRLGSSFPIVPGNVGLAELGYIGGLTLAGGDRAEVVAAVLLFRFITYFVQIPIGGATYLVWRRGRGDAIAAVGSSSSAGSLV